MRRLLTPDLDATVEIDVVEEYYAREVANLERHYDERTASAAGGKASPLRPDEEKAYRDGVEELKRLAASYRAEPSDRHVTARVGYLPACAITALRQDATFSREKPIEERAALGADIDRRVTRLGLRGWTAPGSRPFELEQDRVGRLDRPACPWLVVDLVERSGLMRALCDAIWEFQDLGTEKKTKSLPPPGTSESSSTAASVSTTLA